MPRYTITVKEVWYQPVEIEADSEEEALTRVEEGYGDTVENGFTYSHSLGSDEWLIVRTGE